MNIAIGNDHAGTKYKFEIVKHLENKGIKVFNFGTDDESSMDYPDAIHPVAEAVESGKADLGIILCGSGNGAAMTANHHKDIRAALCWTDELVALARQHNDANILSIPARFVSQDEALKFVDTFLNTSFEGGRHKKRIDKIPVDNC
jgi:ribose 5-phosphate isomerase B